MRARQYFRSMGQSDASRGVRLGIQHMRPWPQWAFDAYAWGWLHQNQTLLGGDMS